jgi:hypothetical protein
MHTSRKRGCIGTITRPMAHVSLSLSLTVCCTRVCVCCTRVLTYSNRISVSLSKRFASSCIHRSCMYSISITALLPQIPTTHTLCVLVCRPNDVVEVTQPPFRLLRKGWGEFPLRIQLFFVDNVRNKQKPIDYIHHLKVRPCVLICTLLLAVGTHTAMHGESLVGSYVLWSGCSRC